MRHIFRRWLKTGAEAGTAIAAIWATATWVDSHQGAGLGLCMFFLALLVAITLWQDERIRRLEELLDMSGK
jgi:hypothetical protein